MFMENKKIIVIALAALLLVGTVIGVSVSNSKADNFSTIGYVNVSYLVSQYVYPKVQGPVKAELEKYQGELDEKIDKLEGTKEEKDAKAKQIFAEYQTLLDKKEKELAAPHLAKLKDAIEAVAKEQGVQIVIDNAPTGVERPVVVWGGVDLTQEVLDSLK